MNQNHLDLEDWELLPDEKFLQIKDHDDDHRGEKKIYSTILTADYFICPSPNSSPEFVDTTRYSNTNCNLPQSDSIPAVIPQQKKEGGDDPVSQVFFNKAMDTEHLDLKVESPRSRGIMPQIEHEGPFHLDIMGDDDSVESRESHEDEIFNIWKWSFSGIGAICSFGMAAAAVCIVILSKRNKHLPRDQKQLQFPIYSYGQGNNRAIHHASTVMAVRGGAHVTRARIICGGSYEATV